MASTSASRDGRTITGRSLSIATVWLASTSGCCICSNSEPSRVAVLLVEHDLFRKPVSTFRDHALFGDHVSMQPHASGRIQLAIDTLDLHLEAGEGVEARL